MEVFLESQAREDFDKLPLVIKARVREILDRLEKWPDVSGEKPLRYEWKGFSRIRTGAWRVIYRVDRGRSIIHVVKIENRKEVYEQD